MCTRVGYTCMPFQTCIVMFSIYLLDSSDYMLITCVEQITNKQKISRHVGLCDCLCTPVHNFHLQRETQTPLCLRAQHPSLASSSRCNRRFHRLSPCTLDHPPCNFPPQLCLAPGQLHSLAPSTPPRMIRPESLPTLASCTVPEILPIVPAQRPFAQCGLKLTKVKFQPHLKHYQLQWDQDQ